MTVLQAIHKAVSAEGSAVLVSIVAAKGSTPRVEGAHLVVTAQGIYGTIGGGALEWKAIGEAQKLLSRGGHVILNIALGPELGQCCGGSVRLLCEYHENAEALLQLCKREEQGPFQLERHGQILKFGSTYQPVAIFGAGHIGKALVIALAPLEVTVTWVDARPNAFPSLVPANVSLLQPDDPVAVLSQLPRRSIVLIMTHSHALDLALCDAALRMTGLGEVGVIGSATKRVLFERRLLEMGIDRNRVAHLICPIGLGSIRSKLPAAIAAGVAAQVLELKEKLETAIHTRQRSAA